MQLRASYRWSTPKLGPEYQVTLTIMETEHGIVDPKSGFVTKFEATLSLLDDSASETNPPRKKRPMERNANAAIKRP